MSAQSLLDAIHALRIDRLGASSLTSKERLQLAEETKNELRQIKSDFVDERDEIRRQWDSRNEQEKAKELAAVAPYQLLNDAIARVGSFLDRLITSDGVLPSSVPEIGTHIYGNEQNWFIGSEIQFLEWSFTQECEELKNKIGMYLLKLKVKQDDDKRKIQLDLEKQEKLSKQLKTSLWLGFAVIFLLAGLPFAYGRGINEQLYWAGVGRQDITWLLSIGYLFVAPSVLIVIFVSSFSLALPGLFYAITFPRTVIKIRAAEHTTKQMEADARKKIADLDAGLKRKGMELQERYEQHVQQLKVRYGLK